LYKNKTCRNFVDSIRYGRGWCVGAWKSWISKVAAILGNGRSGRRNQENATNAKSWKTSGFFFIDIPSLFSSDFSFVYKNNLTKYLKTNLNYLRLTRYKQDYHFLLFLLDFIFSKSLRIFLGVSCWSTYLFSWCLEVPQIDFLVG